MQSLGKCDHAERIETELRWCFTFEPGKQMSCAGASGRKLRQVCVWCPNYQKGVEKDNEKSS